MALQTIVETSEFSKRAEAIGLNRKDVEQIIATLAATPEAGMSLGGGLRKMRIARPGEGKSSGYRVIHFYRHSGLPLFLLTVFAKNERPNISRAERADLIRLCDQIAATYGRKR